MSKIIADALFPHITKTPAEFETKYPPRAAACTTRFAPSPTGFMHIGGLYTALLNCLVAREKDGVFLLRIEDTDQKRQVEGGVSEIISSLRDFDIRFDEGPANETEDYGGYGPYRQSLRREIYQTYARDLVERDLAYPCFCSEEELQALREQQEQAGEPQKGYFGKWAVWRDRPIEDIRAAMEKGLPFVLRFRSTGSLEHKIRFTDLVKGNLELTEHDIDHVLLKSDGIPTYHFAHAVDDHLMRTTHVVRGDEWLPSLPFHLQLFAALGFRPPKYLHIGPLMKMDGESKRKLSKRKDPELALTYYRAAGFPVQSVYEYLLTVLNSNFEDWRRANPDAPTDKFLFSAKKLNPAGALFDAAKLRDVSKNVISRMDTETVYHEVIGFAADYDRDLFDHLTADPDYAKAILTIGRGGKKPRKDFAVFAEVKDYLDFFYDDWFEIKDEYPAAFGKETVKKALLAFAATFDIADDADAWFGKIKKVAADIGFADDMKAYKENPGAYPGNVADVSMFLRLAVTGKLNSPDMYAVMQVLGSDRVNGRIAAMCQKL